jgi:alpha-acetolactate decarboxylase
MTTHSNSIITLISVVAAIGISVSQIRAQHVPHGGPSPHGAEPYGIETFGAFRELMLKGDFSPKVAIGSVMMQMPSTGVGAVSGARGEITILDGKLIISYGKPDGRPVHAEETAALLAIGKVKEWQSVRVDVDVPLAGVEVFLAQIAKAHGLDPEKSFPFQLRGIIAPYGMHVNVAPIGGPHDMGLPMAITVERKGDTIAGSVAGFHVSRALVGIVTHGGERVHAHWVAPDGQSTAHLDFWGIKAGTMLMLPKPE